jgi:hypothetical protein
MIICAQGYAHTCMYVHTHLLTYARIHAVCQVLFDAGADVMAKTPGGCTPYAFASLFNYGDDDIIHFFRREVRVIVCICMCVYGVCTSCA